MQDITFAHKGFFFLFILIPIFIAWYILRQRKIQNNIVISSFVGFRGIKPSFRQYLRHVPFIFRILAFSAIIIVLVRPQSSATGQNVTTEGIDIMLALDISGSMRSEDFTPNRIGAAKKVATEFIDGRPNDRIGLVIFSAEGFSMCPMTTDHAVLKNLFAKVEPGMLDDGTAIGEGLATAVSRIKDSKTKSKVIILMTDGVNNMGKISPADAGVIANTFGIRVYTIGIGTNGTAPYPFKTPFGIQYQQMEVQIDEALLKEIATETGGKYFRATDNTKLTAIYKEIDKLEKTKVELTEFRSYSECFLPYALFAALLLLSEIVLRYTLLRSLP